MNILRNKNKSKYRIKIRITTYNNAKFMNNYRAACKKQNE